MSNTKVKVNGVAIRPGVSKNGIKYSAEELIKFAGTLSNKPILKDHVSAVDNTIGVVEVGSSGTDGVVKYDGWVKEDGTGIIERIKDGRAKEVSIGAFVGRLVKEDDKSEVMVATDIQAMELSITPTPGVTGTSLQHSLESIQKNITDKKVKVLPVCEDVHSFVDFKENLDIKQSEVINMAEEEKAEEPKEEPKEEQPKEEVSDATEKIDSELLKKTEKLGELKAEIRLKEESLKKIKEAEEEPKAEEPKEEEEGEVKKEEKFKGKVTKEDKEADVSDDYIVEASSNGGFSLWKKPATDGRLI